MKRFVLAFLLACAFSTVAFASDVTQYTAEDWKVLYGIPEPRQEDYEDNVAYNAAWNTWYDGFSSFIFERTQAEYARQAQEEAERQAAEEEARKAAEEQDPPAPVETTPTKPIESAGTNNGNGIPAMDNDTEDKYPVGSYVDPAGTVWSPDGTRLTPDASPDTALASGPDEDGLLASDMLDNQSDLPVAPDADTLALIAGLVSDIATDPPTWYVEDLRPTDPPVTVLEGLKALVTSVFGEYSPITTTSVVTETVGNDTYQYLVETVAPGSAGVDYEWLAGVFLFGIMLFCLMKLLGGVLK